MKIQAIFCAFLAMTSVVGLFACSPLEPKKVPLGSLLLNAAGVIGYWNFDETTLGTAPGGSDFADDSGFGHHGKAVGTLQLGVAGIKSRAVHSDGAGAVVIPIDLSSDPVISISVWVNSRATNSQISNVLYEYTANSTIGNGFFASLADSTGSLAQSFLTWMHGTSGFLGKSRPTLSTYLWHNVLAVYDKSNPSQNTITLYVDGSLVSTTQNTNQNMSSSGDFDNSSLYLLCRGGTSLCLNGDIDELILWNKAITSEELSTIYSF